MMITSTGGVDGGNIATLHGGMFNFYAPEDHDFQIEDIALALSRTCRYGGHGKRFLSVAEHSYWASNVCDPLIALECLMHDSAEAFIGDIPAGLKRMPEFRKVIKPIEERIERAIAAKFGLDYPWCEDVHKVDYYMLCWEAPFQFDDAGGEGWAYLQKLRPPVTPPDYWIPEVAYENFLRRFHELSSG